MSATRGPRPLAYAGYLIGGVFLGAAGAVITAARVVVGTTTVPWGLVLSVLTLALCVRGAAWLAGTRRAAAAVLIGWVVAVLTVATVNPGGDVLLPDLPRTTAFLIAGVALGLLAAVWPLPAGAAELAEEGRRRPASQPAEASETDASPRETAETDAQLVEADSEAAVADASPDSSGPAPSASEPSGVDRPGR